MEKKTATKQELDNLYEVAYVYLTKIAEDFPGRKIQLSIDTDGEISMWIEDSALTISHRYYQTTD